jgi:hypothetical protein
MKRRECTACPLPKMLRQLKDPRHAQCRWLLAVEAGAPRLVL